MTFKKTFLLICLIICMFAMASVCASDVAMASEDTDEIGLSVSDAVTDDFKANEDNTPLTQMDNDVISSVGNDLDVLSNNPGTYSQLKKEIDSGGNVTLQHDYYTYDSGGTIYIRGDDRIIDGNGATIDMAGSNIQAFNVNGSGVTIKNLTIKNVNYSNYGGAIQFSDSGAVVNCNFVNNSAVGSGSAIYFSGSGAVENCAFVNNSAYEGGAIYFIGSGAVVNCAFVNNSAYRGGAILTSFGVVENCSFAGNSANQGGAIYSLHWATAADTCIFKTGSDTNVNTVIYPPTLNVDNFTTFYNSGEKLTFDLRTNSSIPVKNGNISISVYNKNNGAWVGNYSCLSGDGWIVDLPIGSYYAIFDTEYAEFKPINRTITVNKAKTELFADSITATYNINKDLIITLKDAKGKPVAGVVISVDLNGIKTFITDSNGQIKVSTGGLVPKTYAVKITFAGNENYLGSFADVKITIKKATPKITAKKKTYKKSKKTKKYTIILKDNTGKAIKNAKITLKIAKKTYKAKTNKKGKATFKIKKLNKKGKYKAIIKYKGNKYYNKLTKKVKITVK